MNKTDYLNQKIKERTMICDGGMGTSIQNLNLSEDDYKGFKGCYEYLNISCPEKIEKIHSDFLKAGCDIIETNTFCANRIMLKKFGLEERSFSINKKAALIAKSIAKEYSTASQPRFVSGSIGPGDKLPSLEEISIDELIQAYIEQAQGLIDGGVDLLQIETCCDPLQIRATLKGIELTKKEKDIPVVVQITIDKNGSIFPGFEIDDFVNMLLSEDLFALGINCGYGPDFLIESIIKLSRLSPFYTSFLPSAGLPALINGKPTYSISPEEFAKKLFEISSEADIDIIGGCCGTTPEHIRKIVDIFKPGY